MSEYTEESVRSELRAWLEENWDPDLSLLEWRNILVDSGWGMPQWPKEWFGRDLPVGFMRVVDEEFKRVDAITVARKGATTLAGSTVLAHGSDMLREKFLRRSLTGEDSWCQLFSEPGNGSDLAGAMTRAERLGNKYVVNGQKVWTTSAHLADFGLLLARTDLDVPKHDGLSYFIIDMRQPGVEVRPIKMINGDSEFNEVFYTDALCPKDNVVGGVNNGWAVAMTLLGFERGEAAATMPIRFQAEIDRLLVLAAERGMTKDPVIRQELMKAYAKVQIMRFSGMRVLTQFLKGHHPGPDGAISKLYWSEYHLTVTELATKILGADAMVPSGRPPSSTFGADDAGAPNSSASWGNTFLSARAGTIYAGSSQVQRNIIGEMVLGLPKEPRPA